MTRKGCIRCDRLVARRGRYASLCVDCADARAEYIPSQAEIERMKRVIRLENRERDMLGEQDE